MTQDNPYLVSISRDLGSLHTGAYGASGAFGTSDRVQRGHLQDFYMPPPESMGLDSASDVTVLVRGKKFLLHRAVLSSCSEYFNFVFQHNQSSTIEVELDKFFSDKNMQNAFTMLAKYFYSGDKKVLKCFDENLKSTITALVDFLHVYGVETNERGHGHFTRFNPSLHD